MLKTALKLFDDKYSAEYTDYQKMVFKLALADRPERAEVFFSATDEVAKELIKHLVD